MEDWLYASGWDPNPSMTKTCDASGSQLEQQLIKLTPENRALVFLAETSDHKQPDRESLGGSYQVRLPSRHRPKQFDAVEITDFGPSVEYVGSYSAQCKAKLGSDRSCAALCLHQCKQQSLRESFSFQWKKAANRSSKNRQFETPFMSC